jgi:hypothetical protein
MVMVLMVNKMKNRLKAEDALTKGAREEDEVT